MNILVTGANGQLGSTLRLVAAQSADRYIFTDVSELDITDAAAIERMVTTNSIGIVINCAAYTNVDKAEDDREQAERLNATAVAYLAAVMKRHDGWLIHISTDYVFGGGLYNTPCKEDRLGKPTGVYGETKLHGEQAIARIGCHHIILRTAWLYSEFGKNFVKSMLNLTATQPELKVVFDQTGTPTYARDLAETIFEMVENRKYTGNEGIYHYSNEGVCSWYDFTKTIAELAGHTSCDILPCHSDEFSSKVKRPAYSVLDKTKIKTTFGIRIPYWMDSLKKCLQNLKEYEY